MRLKFRSSSMTSTAWLSRIVGFSQVLTARSTDTSALDATWPSSRFWRRASLRFQRLRLQAALPESRMWDQTTKSAYENEFGVRKTRVATFMPGTKTLHEKPRKYTGKSIKTTPVRLAFVEYLRRMRRLVCGRLIERAMLGTWSAAGLSSRRADCSARLRRCRRVESRASNSAGMPAERGRRPARASRALFENPPALLRLQTHLECGSRGSNSALAHRVRPTS